MKKISCLDALKIIPTFIFRCLNECVDCPNHELGGDILSGMSMFSFNTGKPMQISTWHDWKIEVNQIISQDFQSAEDLSGNNNPITTWEQGFIAVFFFLNDYYWEGNHTITAETVISDLNKNLALGNGLFDTVLWKEWTTCVKKAMEYNFEYE
jgi:hypothetical protein